MFLSKWYKNRIFIFMLCLLLFSCKTNNNLSKPKPLVINEHYPSSLEADSIYFWRTNNLILNPNTNDLFSYDISKLKPLSRVLEEFKIRDGIIYEKDKPLGNVDILFQYSPSQRWLVKVEDGHMTASYQQENFKQWEYQLFNFNGELTMLGFIESYIYLEKLKDGNGSKKTFYQTDISEKKDLLIKEKGQVKNNLKYGQWTYYNKHGKIDSTKTYTIKDSVDVRFPHCLFNKTEPCY
nr:hypothetical protein [Cochleicola gelatinilyticus]